MKNKYWVGNLNDFLARTLAEQWFKETDFLLKSRNVSSNNSNKEAPKAQEKD